MKRICMLTAVLMLLTIIPATALAEGETTEPSPSPSATQEDLPGSASEFEIDNEHVFDGMDKAFKDGYVPTVKNSTAVVVLPLVANGEVENDEITVTPELGGSSSPFVIKNYQKTVGLADNEAEDGSTIASYLVRFDFPLLKARYNGVYPVSISVKAKGADGSDIQQSFVCYVTITDGKDPNAPEPTEKPETPKSQPVVIISRYSINPSPVEAGGEFTATVTLENTSGDQSVKNMIATVSSDSQNFVLQNDSDTIYLGGLGKGETTDIAITYKTDLGTPPGRYHIMLALAYDDSDAQTLGSSGSVTMEVTQPLRVEMNEPEIAEQVNAGDTMTLGFQVMNLGRSAVYNVRLELEAPGLIPTGTAFIGNMEAGTSMTGEMAVFIGAKNMSEGYEGDEKFGYTSGRVILIYEDEAGEEYTEEIQISTNINEPVITVPEDTDEQEQEAAGQWWISVAIAGAIAAALAAYIIVRKKRREHNDEDI